MNGQCVVRTGTVRGVEAVGVDVEVDVGPGLPSFSIVGLPDVAVQEARERVRSAVRASGFEMPNAKVVVNLAPGPLRKHGTGFDLPIALGLLAATGQLPRSLADSCHAVGELSLDGGVREVPGILAHALRARMLSVPLLCAASWDGCGLEELDARRLVSLAQLRLGLPMPCARTAPPALAAPDTGEPDFADVCGQQLAIRAVLIAAAGGHNILLTGPPGTGKTMLARRLPTILPPLTDPERVETALVHSVAGCDEASALAGVRPFRAPHHTASIAGLVGGGAPPRPGEASLAHNGVLFLDEMPEFGPAALQCLRQPLEDGTVTLVRADGRLRFPARFMLVAASNPCPCGHLGDPSGRCTCGAGAIDRYQSRIGGPLMDRMDMSIRVERPDPGTLTACVAGATSSSLREQVMEARCRADARGAPNTSLSGQDLLDACAMTGDTLEFLETSARVHHLSGRALARTLRVARTIADLDGQARVSRTHMAESLGYRQPGCS